MTIGHGNRVVVHRRACSLMTMAHSLQIPPNCDLTLGLHCVDKSTPGVSTWEMVADERFENPAGIMQGGFISAFVDSAMGASAVTFAEGRSVFVANTELSIRFLSPARSGQRLRCVAEVVKGGSTVAFLEATVTDQDNNVVAKTSSTYIYRDRK